MNKSKPVRVHASSPFDLMHSMANQDVPTRAKENDVLRKIVGERLLSARKINGWSQSEASEKLGYQNSTQLSLWEKAERDIPIPMIIKVSSVYGVSVDYILGLSEESERDPRIAERSVVARQLHGMMQQTSVMLATQLQRYLSGGAPSVLATKAFISKAEEFAGAVNRLRELNQTAFDEDLRGAPLVLRLYDEMLDQLNNAKRMLDRHDRIGEDVIRNVGVRLGVTYPLLDDREQPSRQLF